MTSVSKTAGTAHAASLAPRCSLLAPAAAAGLLLALALIGWSASPLARYIRPDADTGAALDGAGWEGRRLLAQMLWLKTHAVLHAGAEEREARPGEEITRAGEIHHHGEEHEGHDRHEQAMVLVIPPRREDFRGVLGDLERTVKPYADPNGKLFGKSSEQTVPFYRMMTWADPHFIQGYVIGATFLCKAGRYADPGLSFLHEGERCNPASMEIQTELGHFYLVYKKDYPRAEQHLRRAIALIPRGRGLNDLEKDARQDAYRWLALTYRDWNKPQQAVAVAEAGLKAIGEDYTLRNVVRHGGRG